MLNHKKYVARCLLLVILCLLLAGCEKKKEDSLVDKSLIKSEEDYGVVTAKNGKLLGEKNYSASVQYPLETKICSAYSGVVMKKIEVSAGDKVKKGDLLVSIKEVTEETIAEQQKAVETNLEELNKGISNYNSQIAAVEADIANSSGVQKEIFILQKQKIERQLKYYEEDGENVQNDMKKELEILKTLQGDLNIYAPYDGVIDSVENVPEGTELTNTRELLKMHSESEVYISVSEGAELKYNMPVKVTVGQGENTATYDGRVVKADNIVDDAYQDHKAIIRLDEKVDASELKNITVTANLKKLDNVLLVENYAISTQNDKKYVTIVEGDKVMKRPVVIGGGDDERAWIVKGLEEGQNVLIQ